jgi:hypothetical protein
VADASNDRVSTVDVTPTDADFEVAFTRRFMGGPSAWAAELADLIETDTL